MVYFDTNMLQFHTSFTLSGTSTAGMHSEAETQTFHKMFIFAQVSNIYFGKKMYSQLQCLTIKYDEVSSLI